MSPSTAQSEREVTLDKSESGSHYVGKKAAPGARLALAEVDPNVGGRPEELLQLVKRSADASPARAASTESAYEWSSEGDEMCAESLAPRAQRTGQLTGQLTGPPSGPRCFSRPVEFLVFALGPQAPQGPHWGPGEKRETPPPPIERFLHEFQVHGYRYHEPRRE